MGLLDEPRYVLDNVVNNWVEMPENCIREKTFCCGSGTGLNTEEILELRMRGGLPRANAVKYVHEKHDVNMLACVCAIDRATLLALMGYWVPEVRVCGLSELVGNSLILEGVHVHPAYIKNLVVSKDAVVIPIMLGVIKRKKLQRRISGRSTKVPQRRAEKYLKNFENIWGIQSYLLSEADKTDCTIIINDSREDVLREIMLTTINKLAEDFDKTPAEVFG